MSPTDEPSRRRALSATTGLILGTLAGCLDASNGAADARERPDGPGEHDEPNYGHFFDYGTDYDGTRDRRGEDDVRITVGSEPDGLGFDPEAVWVDAGTTVRWEWSGEGGAHDVVSFDGPADLQSPLTDEEGHEYTVEVTEDDEGISRYICRPHEAVGKHGVLVVGSAFDDYVTEYDTTAVDYGDWFENTENVSRTADGDIDNVTDNTTIRDDEVTLSVGGFGYDWTAEEWDTAPVFAEPAFRITTGTTVTWEWVPGDDSHGVAAEDGRFESDVVAVEPADDPDEQTDEHAFSHTFGETGVHEYACPRHGDEGMRGAVVVEAPRR